MTFIVERFDPGAASDEELRKRYELERDIFQETTPEDDSHPFERWRDDFAHVPSYDKRTYWSVWDGDRSHLLATAVLRLQYTESNRHLCTIAGGVRRDARRLGIGTRLVGELAQAAHEDERTVLWSNAEEGSPGDAFLTALGFEKRATERKSRMDMTKVDRAMLEGWIKRASERASDYSLLAWDGPVPDEYVDAFADLQHVMNTAPKDDLDMDDWVHTPDRLRENEQKAIASGWSWWTLVARHDATGELAGYTELAFHADHPDRGEQGDTGVRPSHRDRGLGRWLKASNAVRLLDEKPVVRYVDTWNAFSNDAMLGINIAMGFELVRGYGEFQAPVATFVK